MSITLKKLWQDYGIGGAVIIFMALYALCLLYNYTATKGYAGSEMLTSNENPAYAGSKRSSSTGAPSPAQPNGGNEVFASVNGIQSGNVGSCNRPKENPADLLPKDTNSQWSQLNPAGKGDLSNINLLKAGYHIGIDTIGQSLRNANLQIRSEPPNPQVNTGIWNQSTITPDFMRPPLEIGQGGV
jgi:hypothetical protein